MSDQNTTKNAADVECEALEERAKAARKARDVAAEAEANKALAGLAHFEARVVVNMETTYATIGRASKAWTTRKRATLEGAREAGEAARAKFFEQNPKWTGRAGKRRVRVEIIDLATRAKV